MKILIVSDTHGFHENYINVIELEKPLDLIIHLGDSNGAVNFFEKYAECDFKLIAGNNDFSFHLPDELVFDIGKYHIWLTHGHQYYVKSGLDRLRQNAICKKIDIVMFGHTHMPLIEIGNQVTLLNPGSISFPNQRPQKPSYIIMEIDDKGEAGYEVRYWQ